MISDPNGWFGKTLMVESIKNFISFLLASEKEKLVERIEKIIQARLDYCQKKNGLPYCKNCGICEGDIKLIKEE